MIHWADYLITDIKFVTVNGKSLIELAKTYQSIDDLGNEGLWMARDRILSLTKIGNSFCVSEKGDSWWIPGPYLGIYAINGQPYIKDCEDQTEGDRILYFAQKKCCV